MFLFRFRVQKHGKLLPDRHVAELFELFGTSADHDPVPLMNGQPEQLVPNCASDQVNFHDPMLTHLRILLAASLAWLLSGCGTMYHAQAAGGQMGVLKARRPIDKVVADPATPAPLKARLVDVRSARDFAVTELHLPDNRSYRTYADIKRPFVVWNVVATPEFSVEPKHWCFPIAGCVAYRGYFKEKS